MARFKYKATDESGKFHMGIIEAKNEQELANSLIAKNYTILSISPEKKGFGLIKFINSLRRVKSEEFNIFVRQMATLLGAGVPLLASLNALREQTQDNFLYEIIGNLHSDVEEGESLSEALSKYPNVFNKIFVSMVAAGEAIGALDKTLIKLADMQEKYAEKVSKIKSALRYPIIAFTTLIIAFFIVITFVVPQFTSLFGAFGAQLPLPTKILLFANKMVTQYWLYTLIGLILFISAFLFWINTNKGRVIWDGIKLKIPIMGELIEKTVMSRFCSVVGTLIQSGVNVLQALELTSKVVNNVVIEQEIIMVKQSVNEGKGMATPVRESPFFPPIVSQMVAIGEETGKVDELLIKISEYYDQRVDYMIKNMTTLIEPIFIMILAVFVTILALGIFMPMWSIMSVFRGGGI